MLRLPILLAACLCAGSTLAQTSAVQQIGGANFQGWSGTTGTLAAPGVASYTYPDGPKGAYHFGFRNYDDSAADWSGFYGLRYSVDLPDDREVEFETTIHGGKGVLAVVHVTGKGRHVLELPWSAFAFPQARDSFLQSVKSLTVRALYPDGGAPGSLTMSEPQLIAAPAVALSAEVCGKAAAQGQSAVYSVRVINTTDRPEAIALALVRHGWEEIKSSVGPETLTLGPGETGICTVTAEVTDRIPPGGHEKQVLQAIANGDAANAATLELTTMRELPHPYIVHTPQSWQEVRDKAKHYAWAQASLDQYIQKADSWTVPLVAPPPRNDPHDNYGPYLFATQNENGLMACGICWQLTGKKVYAEKVAEFLRRLSSPVDGYPTTFRACNQSLVQEGHFFQHTAMAYDMILDSGVLSDADRTQIDATLRLFMETIARVQKGASINNWNLAEVTGAFYSALAMQDLEKADHFFAGPGGIEDQLAKGTLDDGWWYECSISYNLWCASEFTQAALAYAPFGVNFKNAWLPANFSDSVMLATELNGGGPVRTGTGQRADRPFGMDPSLYGPIQRPWRTIADLWNGIIPFIDYRGVMFGVNDSTENKVGGNRTEVEGEPFELAYYAFRDPRYASVIKLGGTNRGDLLYGVPELPEKTPDEFRGSAYADNVGLAMLRSQTAGRAIREQIQAVLHYGTHGWAHGHYDRTDLLSLMRYGRSFWNPESVFYVYEPFMYKFYTQTSLNHNMVVVDQKMQEAMPGTRLLWHTGKLMQAAAVETTARWSYPPYGGMVYDYVPVKTFAEKTWREGRSVPIPANPPAYGTLTGYTEPVLQRRLMVVTDDYVVLADYLKAQQPHTFDSLLQLKGFQGLDAPDKKFLRHDAQWNTDPLGGAQFVTDANWYSASAPAVAHFIEKWGPGADEEGSRSIGNEPGALKLDVHSLWPQQQQIMVATAPEQHDTEKRLFYAVRGDGKALTDGSFGAWILGKAEIDVPVSGVKQLELETRIEISKKPTVFWGNARIVTGNGKEIPLSQLPTETTNILPVKTPDHDYLGGPVKIQGDTYEHSTPGQPRNEAQPGLIRVDLSGMGAARFKATLGSDYPPGPEDQRRKVYAIRSQGTEARFLTVIEPYEDEPVIKSASAEGADKLRVELKDGRAQEITLRNFTGSGKDIGVDITQTAPGGEKTQETSGSEAPH